MDKLGSLREQLGKKKLDGYIVPMNDKFQSEFVPPYARILEWLTGFAGSAGVAIVLRQKAAFFTDGRYTLQAKEEVDSDLFEIYNISEKSPYKWLEENVETKEAIGFDPWLHTESQYSKYESISGKKGFFLIPTVENIIYNIWEDRPKEPVEKIFIHDAKYSGLTYWEKREEVLLGMQENEVDAVILAKPESINWLLNIRGRDIDHTPIVLCYAILYMTGVVSLYVDRRKVDGELARELGSEIRIHDIEEIHADLAELQGKRIQIDPETSALQFFEYLNEAGAVIFRYEDPCVIKKACKNEVEIAGAKEAHKRDGAAVCKFLQWLEKSVPGGKVTEMTAAKKLYDLRKKNDLFEGLSFETISGYGANGAIVHYHASKDSDKKIEDGSLYLIDSGAQYLDGTTDITRTVAIGKPTKKQKEYFTYVLKGHIALVMAKFPEGTSGSQLDSIARSELWKGYMDYDHGTGHGVGSFMNVHEGPQGIGKGGSSAPLRPGMIVSNEPGYYLEGEYGIRIENLITVIQDRKSVNKKPYYGFETLTLAPIDLSLVEKDLLTDEEINWLNFYHAVVTKEISPLLDAGAKKWLKSKTQPI